MNNSEHYYVLNINYIDLVNKVIDLNDLTQTVSFNLYDKVILQDNNRSYNSGYYNPNFYKYRQVIEVDNISSKKIRFSIFFQPVIPLNIKNGLNDYFERQLIDEFKSFRLPIRKISKSEYDRIISYLKCLNQDFPISEFLEMELGPRLTNTINRICLEKNIDTVNELTANFAIIQRSYGLGIEGHKLLCRKLTTFFQIKLEGIKSEHILMQTRHVDTPIENDFDVENFRSFLLLNGSTRIINRVDEILNSAVDVGLSRIFGVGIIRGLGEKSLRQLKELVKQFDPDQEYNHQSEKFPLEIEGVLFESKPSVNYLFNLLAYDYKHLTYRACRMIIPKVVDLDGIKPLGKTVDISITTIECRLYYGFIRKGPISFFLLNKYFPDQLDLSKERLRQLFFNDNKNRPLLIKFELDDRKRKFNFDLFGYKFMADNLLVDSLNIEDLSTLKDNDFITNRQFEITFNKKQHIIIFNDTGFERIEEKISQSVSLTKQVVSIMESFVSIHESSGVTTTMIVEDLLEYNLKYTTSQVNDIGRLKSSTLKRRLDKTWVIKDGLFDIDPDFKSFSEWFVFLIKNGKNPIEGIKIVREIYPNYKLRNFVALVQRKLGKEYNFVMLNSELFDRVYLNKLRKVLNSPGLLQYESISWPSFWFEYIERVAVTVISGQHQLVFQCKDFKSCEDFKAIIESFSWKASVVYNYDEE